MKAMEVSVSGIKCDAEECDYIDESITVEDYPNWLNKPCPECGANLLTQDDLNFVELMFGVANLVNEMYPEVSEEERVEMPIHLDGSGVPTNLDEIQEIAEKVADA
jgi:hypothetical protein